MTDKATPTLRQRCDTALQSLPDAPYKTMLAVLFDDMTAEVERLAAQAAPTEPGGDVEPVAWRFRWNPQGDWHITSHEPRGGDGTNKEPLYSASTVAALKAERDAALARATDWQRLYDRAINEANGLTNYVEDRPELRSAERRLDVIAADARALKGQP